jgi:hypothetical protein
MANKDAIYKIRKDPVPPPPPKTIPGNTNLVKLKKEK